MDRKPNAWRVIPRSEISMYKRGNFAKIMNSNYLNGENYIGENGNQNNNYFDGDPNSSSAKTKYVKGKKYLHFFVKPECAKRFLEECEFENPNTPMVILAFELPKSITDNTYHGRYINKLEYFKLEVREEYIIPLEEYDRSFYIRESQPSDFPKIGYDPDGYL